MGSFYLLKWNDEYLDNQIIGGPFEDDISAKTAMKKEILVRLVELNVADDIKEAEKIYADAVNNSGESDDLSVHSEGASIEYSGVYEERYQIVEYFPHKYEEKEGK